MTKVLHKDFFVDGDFGNGYMEEVHNSNFFMVSTFLAFGK
jgi:hypothetical protein